MPLKSELDFVSALVDPDFFATVEASLALGDLGAVAHVLRYLFLHRWRTLAEDLQKKRYVLFACTEYRFVQSIYLVAQREFEYSHTAAVDDLLLPGNAQARLAFMRKIVALCERHSDGLVPQARPGLEKWVSTPRIPSLHRRQSNDEWLPGDSSPQRYLAAQSSRESGDELSESSFPESSSMTRPLRPRSANPAAGSVGGAGGGGGGAGGGGAGGGRGSNLSHESATDLRITQLERTMHTEIARIESQLRRLTSLIADNLSPTSPSSTSTETILSRPARTTTAAAAAHASLGATPASWLAEA